MEKMTKLIDEIKNNIKLQDNHTDGRLNSATNEGSIVELVEQACEKLGYTFVSAPDRHWFDFAFMVDGEFYPVNIKISTCRTADNVGSKIGMFYALTGKHKTGRSLNTWENFMEDLFDLIDTKGNSDYYFLVINKDTLDIFATSLLKMEKLTPNGNNLPFQAKWQDNMKPSNRTREEAIDYVLDVFYKSWEKKCSAFAKLQTLMGERK